MSSKKKLEVINSNGLSARENWEKAMEVDLMTIKAYASNVKRPDMFMDIRVTYAAFFDITTPSFECIKAIWDEVVAMADEMVEIASGLTFEDFAVSPDEFQDPFKKFWDGEFASDNEVFRLNLMFCVVRPYAEKLIEINRLVWEQLQEEQDGAEEK